MAVADNSTGSGGSSGSFFTSRTPILGQKLDVVIIAVVVVMLIIFLLILFFLRLNRNSKRRRIAVKHSSGLFPLEINEIKDSDRTESRKVNELENTNVTFLVEDVVKGVEFGKKGGSESTELDSNRSASSSSVTVSSDGVNNYGWGRLYSLKELKIATNQFSDENVIGEGGYGIVYRGILHDGSVIAVKSLRNNKGQAEKEFKVEVEAIGKVRHKNLVGLIGFCAEGTQRLLVYEYIDNGNLEQWLHGDVGLVSPLTWEIRMKIAIGTARGLAYLHEGSEKSYVTTRVMGTFGYVSPDYASTGMLNEGSDVYSFGILLMELITGRSPVDYSRPPGEMTLVDWFKGMVLSRRGEELVDSMIDVPPPSRSLKRVLLICLRCIDLDANKRPKMGQVVHMLEADEFPYRTEPRSTCETSPLHPRTTRNNKILFSPEDAANNDVQKSRRR
ncbi:unnamed protein product [Fraxinus pennsylvanica]|uniref:non-specific serine/threonine protein kinase n=1 Tax=Fraxinus pennsylvanica TaxID=56036 RepID=A0AAD2EBY6_9LAMI|nr:unnamed protein product [Fraxinus pennsylvanica]